MFYSPEDIVGYIHVNSVSRQPLGAITEADAMSEGGYNRESYFEVITEINDRNPRHHRPYVPLVGTTVLWVVGFTFELSDVIDPNGGTEMRDEYYWRWKDHMARFGIDVALLVPDKFKEMIPNERVTDQKYLL
jgi:hypothetical protein